MRIGDYEVLEQLARGGQGVVYRARDPARGDEVALKLLLEGLDASEVQRKRFRREVQALVRLRHANVVGVRDAGEHRGAPFVVMDFVPGRSLAAVLRERGRLEPRFAAELVRKLALALQHAHDRNVLHRDLKPENIILNGQEPLLTDFGLTRDVDPSRSRTQLSREGLFLGTPGYLSPEQARGALEALGPHSDVYGLGATFYALLTGRPPYQGDDLLELLVRMEQPPARPGQLCPELDPRLETLCLRCLAPEPRSRPQMRDLAWELGEILRAAPPRRARSAAPALIGALLLGGACVGLWALTRPSALDEVERLATFEATTQAEQRQVTELAQQALERLNAYLADHPDHPRALALRALSYHRLDQREPAEADVARALELDPTCAEAWSTRSELRWPDLDQALDDQEQAIRLDPEQARYRWRRAVVLSFQGRQQDALAACRETLALDPRHELALERLGTLLVDQGELEQAEAAFARLIELRPEDPTTHGQRARLRWIRGDLRGALADYDRALAVDPTWAQGFLGRGSVREELGDLAGALGDYEATHRLDPDPAWIEAQRARLGAGR